MKLNLYLLGCAAVAALGGLLFGFDTAVVAGTTHGLVANYGLTSGQLGFTVSIALWGTVVGCLAAGFMGQRIGSREALRITAVLYVVAAVGCGLSWNWSALLAFRFVGGLGVGASSVLAPVYITEVAPARARGRLVGFFQIDIVIGILLAYLSNYLISRQDLGSAEWRWELGAAALPALLFFCLLLVIPSSPRWLVTQSDTGGALDVLQKMGSEDANGELQEILHSLDPKHAPINEPLLSRKYLFPISLAVMLGAFSQMSGINAVLYYLNDIFAAAGFSRTSAGVQSVVVGLVNLAATLIAIYLIDRAGRRRLLLGGTAGMAISLFAMAFLFSNRLQSRNLIYLMVAYIFFFATSLGAVTWVYISEIFPNRVRARGQSLGSMSHWVMNAVISWFFPVLTAWSKPAPFFFFSAMMAMLFVIAFFVLPETKGITLEHLEERFETG